ncbi:MAG: hypothetical protein AAGH38_04315, partial [Pseudomonadota bacterium]
TFEVDPTATRWLSDKGFDEEMGARPLSRVIQEQIKKPIADEILFGSLINGGVVRVSIDKTDEKKLAFEYIPDETPETNDDGDSNGGDSNGGRGDDLDDGKNVPVLIEKP